MVEQNRIQNGGVYMSLQHNGTKASDNTTQTKKDETKKKTLVERVFPGGYSREFKSTMRIAWALVLTQMSQIYFQPVATMFGGHLGKLELDAVSLANTLINVMGNSIIVGFSTALDTVFSQSYGRGNYEMIGVYFQRGLVITVLMLFPCYALHLNMEPILVALGQDREVSRLVGIYLLNFMPGMFFLFMWTTVRKFTQCQNAVYPHIIIILIGHGVHAVLQYVFLYKIGLGITGSAFAQTLTYFTCLIITIGYTLKSAAFKQSWTGFDIRGFQGLGDLARLGVYGMLMLCLEWWAFEVSIIIAGTLGTTELAAQSVTFNLNLLSFAIPSGLAVATSFRVGQLLGAGEPSQAKTAARVGMTITFANSIVWLTVYSSARYELPKIFTTDPGVVAMVSTVLPMVASFTLADAFTTIGRGVLRGSGKQAWGMITIFIAYYCIALPLAIPLTFLTPLHIKGLWLGFTTAIFTVACVYFVLINFKLDWEKLSNEAILRAQGRASGKEKKKLLQNEEEEALITRPKKMTSMDIAQKIVLFSIFILILLTGILVRLLTQGTDDDLEANNLDTETMNSSLSTNTTLII